MKLSLAKFGYLIAILLLMGYAVYTLRGPQGIPGLMEKRHQIQNLEKINADLARDNEQIRERAKRLREDRSAQDLEIQRRLKLVHPGEKVFILQDRDKKPPTSR